MTPGITRADIVIVALALALVTLLYIQLWGNHSQGEAVYISVAGKESLTLPLDSDKRLEIEGAMGISTIEIKARQVRFINSPCHNKQCLISGYLKKDGELAACLPNGISIQIKGRDSRFDAVNF